MKVYPKLIELHDAKQDPEFVMFITEHSDRVFGLTSDEINDYTFWDLLIAWTMKAYNISAQDAEDKCYCYKPTMVIYEPRNKTAWEFEYGRIVIH